MVPIPGGVSGTLTARHTRHPLLSRTSSPDIQLIQPRPECLPGGASRKDANPRATEFSFLTPGGHMICRSGHLGPKTERLRPLGRCGTGSHVFVGRDPPSRRVCPLSLLPCPLSCYPVLLTFPSLPALSRSLQSPSQEVASVGGHVTS